MMPATWYLEVSRPPLENKLANGSISAIYSTLSSSEPRLRCASFINGSVHGCSPSVAFISLLTYQPSFLSKFLQCTHYKLSKS